MKNRLKTIGTKFQPTKTVCLALGFVGAVGLFHSPSATAQEYSDFSDTNGLVLNGSAAQVGSVLRLTPATGTDHYKASAWHQNRQNVRNGFETTFQFQISERDAKLGGADGIAFVIQNQSLDALGAAGGGMGYGEDKTTKAKGISNSVAIELDTYMNPVHSDTTANSISVHTNGTGPNNASETFSIGSVEANSDMSDGAVHTVKIVYVPGRLDIYLDDLTSPALSVRLNLNTTLDLFRGQAYVGFTSSLATARENHDILNWSFSPTRADNSTTLPDALPDTYR